MPYSETALNTTGTALTAQMKTAVDAAIVASGKFGAAPVTAGYVSTTRSYDVWKNDGTTDGYEWYLIVGTDTANTGRVLFGGALEYSDATKIAKKAIRGYTTIGFTDSNGYPLVSSGGAEMTFALGAFVPTNTNNAGMLGSSNAWPASAASGNTLRVLVTGQVAWLWYGTATTPTYCHGIGTYQKLHSHAGDQKPLASLVHTTGSGGGTPWQHPAASSITSIRGTAGNAFTGTAADLYTVTIGQVGAGVDASFTQYVGSRAFVTRQSVPAGGGGQSETPTNGTFLGLAPADFLIFSRVVGTAIGDTVTVNGKAYVSISSPAAAAGYFINTQPAV